MSPTDTDALKKDIEALKRDLRALTDSIKHSSEQRAQDGIDSARDTYEQLRSQASRRTKEAGAEIEARPFTSVFAAFGIGLLLGKLISR